jgi:galactose mutarotase-like enzyme
LFQLSNESGVELGIINLGATLTSWCMPDTKGNIGNIVLGYDNKIEKTTDYTLREWFQNKEIKPFTVTNSSNIKIKE